MKACGGREEGQEKRLEKSRGGEREGRREKLHSLFHYPVCCAESLRGTGFIKCIFIILSTHVHTHTQKAKGKCSTVICFLFYHFF